jgi:cysteine desulfurase
MQVCRFLEEEGYELTILPVNSSGCVEPETLQQALRRDTILVSLMQINNEIGSLNDITGLGGIIKAQSNAFFHVDAAQSVGKYTHHLDAGDVDLLSFSAHKFFGLKGSGALVLGKRMELPPFIHGGGQEAGLRSGTADAARAAALAKALRLSLEQHSDAFERVQSYRQAIADAVAGIDGAELNGSLSNASPFIINFSVAGIRPEPLLQALGEKEIYISTVSACSAQSKDESSVVFALTGSRERAGSSVRISLSSLTTAEEVEVLCGTLGPVIDSLRLQRK